METYCLVVLEGAEAQVRGFLAGWAAAAKLDWSVLFCEESGVRTEGFAHRLLERMRIDAETTHLLVPRDLCGPLREVLAALPPRSGVSLKLRAEQEIESASLAFRYRAFSRDTAARIRGILADLPAGARLTDTKEEEHVDPGATGVEVYAPEHDYRLTGSARVSGPLASVLAARARMEPVEMIDLEPIQLVLRDSGR